MNAAMSFERNFGQDTKYDQSHLIRISVWLIILEGYVSHKRYSTYLKIFRTWDAIVEARATHSPQESTALQPQASPKPVVQRQLLKLRGIMRCI